MERVGTKCIQGGGGVFSTLLATPKVPGPHWDPRLVDIAMSSRPLGRAKGESPPKGFGEACSAPSR